MTRCFTGSQCKRDRTMWSRRLVDTFSVNAFQHLLDQIDLVTYCTVSKFREVCVLFQIRELTDRHNRHADHDTVHRMGE